MIKKHISLREAEKLFPGSTVEWEVAGGNDLAAASYSVNAVGIPAIRWNVLRDVLCVGWFTPIDQKPHRADFNEMAFWTLDVKGVELTAINDGGFSLKYAPSPSVAREGRWVFPDRVRIWAFDRNWRRHSEHLR